jgi:N-acyl-D-amino-acid deacylase
VLISNAILVDGTGAPRRPADVVVRGGLIAEIASALSSEPGGSGPDRAIDATGLVLSPGFIDMHAHSDLQLLTHPANYAKISQGVTTELLGQDGLSYAPVDDVTLTGVRQQIAGWNDNPPDFDFSWRTVGEYLDRLDTASPPTLPISCRRERSVPW